MSMTSGLVCRTGCSGENVVCRGPCLVLCSWGWYIGTVECGVSSLSWPISDSLHCCWATLVGSGDRCTRSDIPSSIRRMHSVKRRWSSPRRVMNDSSMDKRSPNGSVRSGLRFAGRRSAVSCSYWHSWSFWPEWLNYVYLIISNL
jgi:hypothetical protein